MKIKYLKTNEGFRVQRDDWPSDAFEIVDEGTFALIQQVMPIFSIPVEEIIE